MEFEKSRRRYYESWIYHDKLNDCVIHIYHINKAKNYENGVYHFTVVGNNCSFSSISNDMLYLQFDECVEDIYKWRMKKFNIEELG